MPIPHAGEIAALLAPLAWSTAMILYKQTHAPAVSINLFKNTLAVVLLAVTMLVIGEAPPADRPWTDWLRLGVSGLLGLSIADTLLFMGLAKVGASKVAIVDTVYAPVVVLLSWGVLGERPTGAFLVGAALVVGGIVLATVHKDALRVGARDELVGMALAGLAVSSTACAVVLAKPVLEHSGLVEVTTTRLAFGLLGQLVWLGATRRWANAGVAFRPGPLWRTLVPAAFIGTYVSMMLWLGGYKWADASVAAVLNQMATVYILAMARFVLGERLRPAQIVGAGLAACGALWIVLSRL